MPAVEFQPFDLNSEAVRDRLTPIDPLLLRATRRASISPRTRVAVVVLAVTGALIGPTLSQKDGEQPSTSILQVETVEAWNQPICNPVTGEVKQPGDFKSEEEYNQYLKEHPGSFIMEGDQKCLKF